MQGKQQKDFSGGGGGGGDDYQWCSPTLSSKGCVPCYLYF